MIFKITILTNFRTHFLLSSRLSCFYDTYPWRNRQKSTIWFSGNASIWDDCAKCFAV